LKAIANQESERLIGFHRKDNPCLNEFKEYLIFAKEQSALTKKRIGDLRAFDWAHFVQTKNELLVAYFIHKYLGYENITFDPLSYLGNGKGDLEITIGNGKKIFIEITSPYRKFPNCGSMNWDYSGTIKKSLSKKYLKLPKDDRIKIIILGYGLRDTKPRKDEMIKALYGIEDEEFKVSADFVSKGFYQQNKTNLSAVGVIVCESDYVCEIFHNPYAEQPMPKEIFSKFTSTEQYFNGFDWLKSIPKQKKCSLVKKCSTP